MVGRSGLILVWRRGRTVRLQGSTWDETEVRDAKLDEGIVAEVEVEVTEVEIGTQDENHEVEVEIGTLDENHEDLEVRTGLLGERGQSVLTRGTTGTDNFPETWNIEIGLKFKWLSWKAKKKQNKKRAEPWHHVPED